jgi:squalene cyclase
MWFGVEALAITGNRDSENVHRACKFLLDHQRPDGSWGEDFTSCWERDWVEAKEGHATHTAWACLTLMEACRDNDLDKKAIRRGIKWIINRQLPNGNYPVEQICGVFNFSCAIAYDGYKNYFSFWAMGKFMTYKYGGNLAISEL